MSSALSPAASAPPSWGEVLHHLWPVFLMGLSMTLLYLPGFHRPEPHDVPIAVVGTSPQAERLAAELPAQLGERVEVRRIADQSAADQALRQLTVSGALAPTDDGVRLSVAGAASHTTASTVQAMVRHVVEPAGGRVAVRDVAPLPESDPIGQNAFFLLVVTSVGSYSMGIGVAVAAARRRLRERLLAGLVAAVAVTAAVMLVSVGGMGMFPGHEGAVAAVVLLASSAIVLVALGVHVLAGRFTTMVLATAFVAISFTSSGGVFEPLLQPQAFGWLHRFWIGSGVVQALTRLLYFPETSLARPLAILLGWLAAGALLVAAAAVAERRRARGAAGRERTAEEALEDELEEDVAV